MNVKANGLDFEVEINEPGRPDGAPTVLLIMGLGMQLVAWPPAFVKALTDAGYRVLRLDNRDIGLSHKSTAKVPNLAWMGIKSRLGLPITASTSTKCSMMSSRCRLFGRFNKAIVAAGVA